MRIFIAVVVMMLCTPRSSDACEGWWTVEGKRFLVVRGPAGYELRSHMTELGGPHFAGFHASLKNGQCKLKVEATLALAGYVRSCGYSLTESGGHYQGRVTCQNFDDAAEQPRPVTGARTPATAADQMFNSEAIKQDFKSFWDEATSEGRCELPVMTLHLSGRLVIIEALISKDSGLDSFSVNGVDQHYKDHCVANISERWPGFPNYSGQDQRAVFRFRIP